ncbi:MAG TPA: hypothetical protein VFK80_04185 [Limnochordia bacterium]|nr:hypothetical protein [Limnochordia bacterium]
MTGTRPGLNSVRGTIRRRCTLTFARCRRRLQTEVAMLVKEGKAAARAWVDANAETLPGFVGAFFHGSTHWLPEDAPLATGSDVDVMVVLHEPPPVKLGKFTYRGVLLEVSYLPAEDVRSAEHVLGLSHLAGSFRAPGIIADPTGELTRLQVAVAQGYAKRKWVRRRCEHAQAKVFGNLEFQRAGEAFHDQAMAFLFAAGVTTHVLLVAGLKNPTVRRRYLAVRQLLAEYDRRDFYEPLLALLGCAGMSAQRAKLHLAALTEAFDAANKVVKSPFFFASDLSDAARPIAIDGSRELIEAGNHREAVFWLAATYSRCLKVFQADAPGLFERYEPGYRRLLADMDITSFADLKRRGEAVRAALPAVWAVAEAIMAANPEIED